MQTRRKLPLRRACGSASNRTRRIPSCAATARSAARRRAAAATPSTSWARRPRCKVRGTKNVARLPRAHRGARRCAQAAVAGAPALLRPVRERAVGLRPALAAVGLSVRVGDRHAVAQAAGRRRADAQLRREVGRRAEGSRAHALSRVPARGHRRLAREARADGSLSGNAASTCAPTADRGTYVLARMADRSPTGRASCRRRRRHAGRAPECGCRCGIPSPRPAAARCCRRWTEVRGARGERERHEGEREVLHRRSSEGGRAWTRRRRAKKAAIVTEIVATGQLKVIRIREARARRNRSTRSAPARPAMHR